MKKLKIIRGNHNLNDNAVFAAEVINRWFKSYMESDDDVSERDLLHLLLPQPPSSFRHGNPIMTHEDRHTALINATEVLGCPFSAPQEMQEGIVLVPKFSLYLSEERQEKAKSYLLQSPEWREQLPTVGDEVDLFLSATDKEERKRFTVKKVHPQYTAFTDSETGVYGVPVYRVFGIDI